MANKKNKSFKNQSPKGSQPVKPVAKPAASLKNRNALQYNKWFIIVPLLLTLAVYLFSGSLTNGWIKNWDDGGYVTETGPNNILSAKNIHHLTGENLEDVFTKFYKGNYHPLTTLVYAFEYMLVGDSPFLYHLLNLLFHLANVYLVFLFLMLITRRVEIAGIAAVLFGIHPMHVESVAWISELKDVMYTFFFLLSMIYYYYYVTRSEKKSKYFIISLVSLLLSLLSKSAAVTLPVVLLLIDYYMRRKWSWKLLYEKIPFFLLSLACGLTAIFSQGSAGAIQDLTPLYSAFERIFLASGATLTYIWKLFVPIQLSAMHPYPDRIDGHLPLYFYIAPVAVLVIAALVFYSRKFTRDLVFGSLFFIVTISLVIQLLPVGGALVAERYSYVPYIGFFMIIGKGYIYAKEGQSQLAQKIRMIFPALLIVMILVQSFMSFQRIGKWKDGKVLFTEVISAYPNLPFAYNNRGYFNMSFGEDYYKDVYKKAGYTDSKTMAYDSALADFNKSISIDQSFHQAYSNRGVLYYNFAYHFTNKDSIYQLAINDFDLATKYKSDNNDAIIGRAKTYATLKQFDKALADYNSYINMKDKIRGTFEWDMYRCRAIAYYNLGAACLARNNSDSANTFFDLAMSDIAVAIENNPSNADNFYQRGYIYLLKKEYETAIADFNKSISMDASQYLPLFCRADANYKLKNYDAALKDYAAAIKINPDDPSAYLNRSEIYILQENYAEIVNDYTKIISLQPNNALAYQRRAYAYNKLGKEKEALADQNKAVSLSQGK